MFGVLYFLMIRPQMKRAKEHKTMIEALQKGDEVVTAGGVLGRITKVSESYVTARNRAQRGIQVQRAAVQLVLPKGTIKNSSERDGEGERNAYTVRSSHRSSPVTPHA